MAEEKIILLEVDIKMDDAIANQKKLTEELIEAKKAADALKKSEGETSEAYIKKNAEVKAITKELNSQKAITEKVIATNRANTGSIDETRAALSVVSAKWSALSKEQRLNTDEGKKLTAQKKELTEQLKKEEAATGDSRRNVGNYTDALGQLGGKMGGAIQGFLGMAKAAWAFIATPIGVIIAAVALAIGAVVSIFKKFEPLLEWFERKIAAVSAVLSVLKDVFLSVFTGTKSLTEAFDGVGSAMAQAAREAEDLKRAQQELEDQQILMIESEAKQKRQIDELLLQSKDRSKSEKERISLIDEALKIEEEAYNKKKLFADTEYQQAVRQIAIDNQLTDEQEKNLLEKGTAYLQSLQQIKGINDEEVKSFAETSAKREQVLNESIMIREKAINRQNALLEKAEEAELKRIEKQKAAQEKKAEEEQKILDKTIADAEKLNQYYLDAQKKTEELQREIRLQAFEKGKEDREAQRQWERDRLAIDLENQMQIRVLQNESEFEIMRDDLANRTAYELEQAEKTGANLVAIQQKYSLAKMQIDRAEFNSKMIAYQGMAGNIAELFRKQTKIGKIAASAQTAINTYLGAQAVFAQTPGGIVIKSIAAGLATAVGLKNIAAIWAVKSGLPGDSGGGGAVTPAGGANVNPSIGQGIVSRDIPNNSNQVNVSNQPTLVIDSVTAAQQQQQRINETQAI